MSSGEININIIATSDGLIRMEFSASVKSVTLPPDRARQLAAILINQVEAITQFEQQGGRTQ